MDTYLKEKLFEKLNPSDASHLALVFLIQEEINSQTSRAKTEMKDLLLTATLVQPDKAGIKQVEDGLNTAGPKDFNVVQKEWHFPKYGDKVKYVKAPTYVDTYAVDFVSKLVIGNVYEMLQCSSVMAAMQPSDAPSDWWYKNTVPAIGISQNGAVFFIPLTCFEPA